MAFWLDTVGTVPVVRSVALRTLPPLVPAIAQIIKTIAKQTTTMGRMIA
jgi:hypothetical protein